MHLIEAGPVILNSFDAALSRLISSQLLRRRVTVRTSVSVTSFDAGAKLVHLSDGSSISSACVVWNAGLQPIKLMTESLSTLRKGAGGRVVVDAHLRVAAPECHGRVFAIGDCAIDPDKPCPPIAQAAKQQGQHLANAFNAASAAEGGGQSLQVPPFSLRHMGSMVTWGGFQGAVDMHSVGHSGRERNFGVVAGTAAYLMWRSAYWGMQTSWANKLLIPMYWFKAFVCVQCYSRQQPHAVGDAPAGSGVTSASFKVVLKAASFAGVNSPILPAFIWPI